MRKRILALFLAVSTFMLQAAGTGQVVQAAEISSEAVQPEEAQPDEIQPEEDKNADTEATEEAENASEGESEDKEPGSQDQAEMQDQMENESGSDQTDAAMEDDRENSDVEKGTKGKAASSSSLQRTAVDKYMMLTVGQTLEQVTGDMTEYAFQPEASGWYHLKAVSENGQDLSLNLDRVIYYTEDESGNRVEHIADKWRYMGQRTECDQVMWLNKDEIYIFNYGASDNYATDEYSFSLSMKEAKIDRLEVAENPTETSYSSLNYEGMKVKMIYENGDSTISNVSPYGKLDAFDWHNVAHQDGESVYNNLSLISVDGSEIPDWSTVSDGAHTAKVCFKLTDSLSYEFDVPFTQGKNNIESLEVLDPMTEYTQYFGENLGKYKEDFKIKIKYNDGTPEKTLSSQHREISAVLKYTEGEISQETGEIDTYLKNGGKPGDATVYVSYRGVEASYTIRINENPYERMEFEINREKYYTNCEYQFGDFSDEGDRVRDYGDIRKITLYRKDGKVETYDGYYNLPEYYQRHGGFGFVKNGEVGTTWVDEYLRDGTAPGPAEVGVTYCGLTATRSVTIEENPYDHIVIAKEPDKLQYVVNSDESLNLNGMIIHAYKDKQETADNYDVYDLNDFNLGDMEHESSEQAVIMNRLFRTHIGGHDSIHYLETGRHNITVSLMGHQAVFQIKVVEKLVNSLTIEQAPEKVEYYAETISQWEGMEYSGMILSVEDLQGVSKKYRMGYNGDDQYSDWAEIEGFVSYDTSEVQWNVPGTYDVKVSCLGAVDSFQITLLDNPVKSIGVQGTLKKTIYYQYEAYQNQFDLTGLTLTVQFTDGTSKKIELSDSYNTVPYKNDSFRVKKYWKRTFNGEVVIGENTVSLSVAGKKMDAATVTVKENPVASIKITGEPEKKQYFGRDDYADLYGMKLLITYVNGTEEEVSVTEHTDKVEVKNECGGNITAYVSRDNENGTYTKTLHVNYRNEQCTMDVTADISHITSTAIQNESCQKAVLSKANPQIVYAFTPEKDGTYHFFSDGSSDSYGELYDGNFKQLDDDDDSGEDVNFRITSNLTAGATYYYVVSMLGFGDEGTFNCYLSSTVSSLKEAAIKEYKITKPAKDTWYDFESDNIWLDMDEENLYGTEYELIYENGWVKTGKITDNEGQLIDGVELSLRWKYTKEEDGEIIVDIRNDNALIYTWGEKTFTFPVTFHKPSPVKELTLVSNPWEKQTIYQYLAQDDRMSPYGLSVKVQYLDGREEKVVEWKDENDYFYSKELNGYWMSLMWDGEPAVGSQNAVRVAYMGKTLEIPVTLAENPVTSIELISAPQKTEYYPFELWNDEFDFYGAKLRIHYTDQTTKDAEWDVHDSYMVIDDQYNEKTFLQITYSDDGERKISISYLGGSSEEITVRQKAFTKGDSRPASTGMEYDVALGGEKQQYAIISFMPSETGSYGFICQNENVETQVSLFSESGESMGDGYGKLDRILIKDRTYYFVIIYRSSGEQNFKYLIMKNPEGEREEIGELYINVNSPTVGMALPDCTNSSSDEYGVYHYTWYQSGTECQKGDTADYASAYRLMLRLGANAGWKFTSNTTVYVNGDKVTAKSIDMNGILTLYYTFPHTPCKVTVPAIEGYDTDETENPVQGQIAYGGEYCFSYMKKADNHSRDELIVKANGNVLTPDDQGIYTIKNVRENITVSVKSGTVETTQGDSRLTLHNQSPKVFDTIIGKQNQKLADNKDGETTLPVLDSYADGSDQFFFGWYQDKDSSNNGKGTRLTSKTVLEQPEYNLYSKYGTGIFSAILNTKQVNYKILSIDEDNRTKVQVGDGSSRTAKAAKVSLFSRMARALTNQNTLEIPASLDLNQHEELGGLGVNFGESEVVAIAPNAFAGSEDITEVVLPHTIQSIGENAFENCTGLTNVTIPEGVSEIGSNAFKDCQSLEEITVPSTVKTIQEGTFQNCGKLNSVKLAEGVSAISSSAFDGCESLKTVTIPDSIETIEAGAFSKADVTIFCSKNMKDSGKLDTLKESLGNELKIVTVELKLSYNSDRKTFCYGDKEQTFEAAVSIDEEDSPDREVTWSYPETTAYDFVKSNNGRSLTVVPKRATEEDETVKITVEDKETKKQKSIILNTRPRDLTTDAPAFSIKPIGTQTWTGKEIRPAVQVVSGNTTLGSGDYEVSYQNNINPGKGTVIVTGKGNYCGELTAEFVIEKKTTSVQKQDPGLAVQKILYQIPYKSKPFSLKAKSKCPITYTTSNSKVATVSPSGVVTVKKCGAAVITLKTGNANYISVTKTVTIKVVPKKAAISKARSKKAKQITVSWKKCSEAAGYVIECSTRKDFKKGVRKVTVKKNKTKSVTIKNLKKGKKYYVRMRAYTKIGKGKAYGGYSKKLKVTVKK